MALTIITKFLPATEHRGDRIKVTCSNGWTKTYSWKFMDGDNHALAIWQFLNEKFDTPAANADSGYISHNSYILPIAGMHQDNTGWYTDAQTINNCGRVVIVDYIQYVKWCELQYLL